MIYSHYTGRVLVLIIIAVVFVPEIDNLNYGLQKMIPIVSLVTISQAIFPTVLFLLVVSFRISSILQFLGIRFFDALVCSVIGIAAHFFVDGLVYNPGNAFFIAIHFAKIRNWDDEVNTGYFWHCRK